MRDGNPTLPNTGLCEMMLSPQNLGVAVQNVKRNKGSAGVDGMEVEEIDAFMCQHWAYVEELILARKYRPRPVKRVEIPKDNGGVRLLGVPCVIDRVIQQAMVQVMQPLFEATFSEFSYGFRPGRSAEDAVRQAQTYMAEGYDHVVDLDLSKFFDTVDHDILMGLVDKTLEDKDIRRLVWVYLRSGVMTDGCFERTLVGTPQGGPLSPLLANIYLTPYDKELERRTLKFVRYADDCNIFARSKYASKQIEANATKFLEKRLKLKVNRDKTEARKAVGSSFLGFEFLTIGSSSNRSGLGVCRPKAKKLEKFKDRVREITSRSRGVGIGVVVGELNGYIRGWLNYYARANMASWVRDNASWARRRVRQYLWKQWKTAKNRKHQLRLLGNEEWKLDKMCGYGAGRYWACSGRLGGLIPNKVLEERYGLLDIDGYYRRLHEGRICADWLFLEGKKQLTFGF